MNEQSYTVKKAAEYLGVSSRMVYQLAAPNGPIPCYRIGRRVVFDITDVQAFKQSSHVDPIEEKRTRLKSTHFSVPSSESGLLATFARLGIKPRLSIK